MRNLKYQKTLMVLILGLSTYAGAQSATTSNNVKADRAQNMANSPDAPRNPAFPNQNQMVYPEPTPIRGVVPDSGNNQVPGTNSNSGSFPAATPQPSATPIPTPTPDPRAEMPNYRPLPGGSIY